jgi:outer membrane protein assembly factor BamD (BamD/ComL family)
MRPSVSSFAFIAAVALLAASGCAGTWRLSPDSPEQKQPNASEAVQNKVEEAQKLVQSSKYPEAVSAYRLVLLEHPTTEWAPEAKFGIALTYVSADNPHKDYAAAIVEFDEFLSLYPTDKRAAEAKSWTHVLKAFIETKKENDRLNKNIEKLKQLDVRQEKKRLGR